MTKYLKSIWACSLSHSWHVPIFYSHPHPTRDGQNWKELKISLDLFASWSLSSYLIQKQPDWFNNHSPPCYQLPCLLFISTLVVILNQLQVIVKPGLVQPISDKLICRSWTPIVQWVIIEPGLAQSAIINIPAKTYHQYFSLNYEQGRDLVLHCIVKIQPGLV